MVRQKSMYSKVDFDNRFLQYARGQFRNWQADALYWANQMHSSESDEHFHICLKLFQRARRAMNIALNEIDRLLKV